MWQRDKVGREMGQSSCEDQSMLSWLFNLINQCFLVHGNREWCRKGGREAKEEIHRIKAGQFVQRVLLGMWVYFECVSVILLEVLMG